MLRFIAALILALSQSAALAADRRYEQCVRDLCGPPENLFGFKGILKEGKIPKLAEPYLKTIEPLLKEYLEQSRIRLGFYAQAVKHLENDDKPIVILNNTQLAMAIEFVIGAVMENPKMLTYENKVPGVNDELLRATIPAANVENQNWVARVLKASFGSQFSRVWARSLDFDSLSEFLGAWHIPGSRQERLNQVADVIQTAIDKGSPLGMVYHSQKGALEKLRKDEPLSIPEQHLLYADLKRSLIFSSFFVPEAYRSLINPPFSPAQLIQAFNIKSRTEKLVHDTNDKAWWANHRSRSIQLCRKQIAASLNFALPKADFEVNRQKLERWREAAIELLPRFMSQASADDLAPRLRNVQLELPPSREDVAVVVKGIVESYLQSLREENRMFAAAAQEGKWENILTDVRHRIHGQRAVSLEDVCESLSPGLPVDLTFEDQDSLRRVHVSWMSFYFPNSGAYIFGHEFGHVVYAHAKNYELESVHSCLLEKQKNFVSGINFSLEKYEDEEFADHFGTAVGEKILGAKSKTTLNPACPWVPVTERPPAFEQLELINPNVKDEHSSTLYRLIRFQSELGRPLPKSCAVLGNPEGLEGLKKTCDKSGQ